MRTMIDATGEEGVDGRHKAGHDDCDDCDDCDVAMTNAAAQPTGELALRTVAPEQDQNRSAR